MSGGLRSYEVARRLVLAGHEIELITSWRESVNKNEWFSTVENGINVHWLPNLYSNKMNFLRRSISFLRFSYKSALKAYSIKNADIIFATSTPLTIAIPALIVSKLRRIPMVFEVRDLWPSVPIAMGILKNSLIIYFAKLLEIITYKHSSHIIVLAPGMKKKILSLGIKSHKVSVIPNGCDFELVQEIKKNTQLNIRDKFKWLGKRKLILFAGTLGRANGVIFLVDIAKEMIKIDSNIRFVIIGDGHDKDKIKNRAESLNILNKNLFMFDAMSKKDVFNWILISDITTAFFSGPKILWEDAVQNKFFDSLVAGRPVACNFKGFQSKLSLKENFGIILDPFSASKSAKDLFKILHNPIWLKKANINAFRLAKGRFNFDKLAHDIEVILNSYTLKV